MSGTAAQRTERLAHGACEFSGGRGRTASSKMMSIEIADNTRGIAPSARCGSGLAGPWTGQEWRSVGGMRSGESSISMDPS